MCDATPDWANLAAAEAAAAWATCTALTVVMARRNARSSVREAELRSSMSRDSRSAWSDRVVRVWFVGGQDVVGDGFDGGLDRGHRGAQLVGQVGHQLDPRAFGGLQATPPGRCRR